MSKKEVALQPPRDETLKPTSIALTSSMMKTLALARDMTGENMSEIVRKALLHYFNNQKYMKSFSVDSQIPHIERKAMIPASLYLQLRNIEPTTLDRWITQEKVVVYELQNKIGETVKMIGVELNDPLAVAAKLTLIENMLNGVFDNFKEVFTREAHFEKNLEYIESNMGENKKLLDHIAKLEKRLDKLEKLCATKTATK